MVTLYDVPADALIEDVADRLEDRIEEPEWMAFAKTGQTRELPPQQDNFWYVRTASLLRKVAMNGPVGVDRLSTEYGGRKRGTNRYVVSGKHSDTGSKNIIRTALQQLEEEGLIRTAQGEGRVITDEGRSFLDNAAADVFESLDRPELERYA
ncbi:30S ribosomal protein S19e [Halogeometricum borinquense DSM 11551]|uniref:Small ribosomal subunit protein eS19 n=2 Tax=Halogeometricum borinquense TaxID=60847 RepID=E4NLG7_HALBP|nr:30S ribosomal protein S19e [Halogeometricum borinquense]ADQ66063.1 SSU ribosomal protein S19E [Halogeometricum borinquense DSM 11551]ELY27441.1 30S ribosomal protein S19e [Halogeometricum borinquense DSM 11551]RYJ13766.1 30S ribosomal protein S19e [Halogeometricum borinquense]